MLRANRLIPGIAFVLILGFMTEVSPQGAGEWITAAKQRELTEQVRTALPQGWRITRTAANSTPDDWNTLDPRGFLVQGENAERTFRSWFVPKDWLGIRVVQPQRVVYWEGILSGAEFKLITFGDVDAFLQAHTSKSSNSLP